MAKAKETYTMNGVLPIEVQGMTNKIKEAAGTSRKEVGLTLALKFITSSKDRMRAFKRYAWKNQKLADSVRNVLDKHEKGKR